MIENGPDIPAFDFLCDNLNNYVSEILNSSVTVENSAKCCFHTAAVDYDAPFELSQFPMNQKGLNKVPMNHHAGGYSC